MAAQLEPGYRAVAIEIEAQHRGRRLHPAQRPRRCHRHHRGRSEGGGDQVRSDIVLARHSRAGARTTRRKRKPPAKRPNAIDASVAVLEMTAEDARAARAGRRTGRIELGAARRASRNRRHAARHRQRDAQSAAGTVRVHAFGTVCRRRPDERGSSRFARRSPRRFRRRIAFAPGYAPRKSSRPTRARHAHQ